MWLLIGEHIQIFNHILAAISGIDGPALLILQPSTTPIEDGVGLLTQVPSTLIDLIRGQSRNVVGGLFAVPGGVISLG
jgi:hypothetical protein